MTQPITELKPADFQMCKRLVLYYGNTGQCAERFVTTKIGRIVYAVSMDYGYAYTRLQLICKYDNIAATFNVQPLDGH